MAWKSSRVSPRMSTSDPLLLVAALVRRAQRVGLLAPAAPLEVCGRPHHVTEQRSRGGFVAVSFGASGPLACLVGHVGSHGLPLPVVARLCGVTCIQPTMELGEVKGYTGMRNRVN